jgi:GT2 family glycosyltransferase/glycosyltransferase involved in cell wall biosynthesis
VIADSGAEGAEPPRPGVDIVVPVYNARELVLRCIASAALHAHGDFRIVVVDDASTDRALTRELDRLASEDPLIVLLRNEKNLGFVGTANRGIRHAGGRDVLLLNSDTEVFEGFLDRLRDAAYSDDHAGMVSPLSNNATICSVPDFCRNNALPDGITGAEMAELVARASDRSRPELVTPHGFCLYLRSDFVAEVGVFDEERFGRGFGEENDLGERAKAAGWRTLLADDVYVWHAGKASFGDEGWDLERLNESALLEKHPGYRAAVARFVEANPLSAVQQRVRRHLRRRSHRVEPSPLFVLHASPFGDNPGGVEHCVRDLVSALRLPRVVLAYPSDFALEIAEVIDGDLEKPLFYRIPLGTMPGRFSHEHPEAVRAFETVLSLFRIAWVHIHHLMFLPLSLGRLFAERGLHYVVTVHDFYPACPSYNLLDVRTTTGCCTASCTREQALSCQRALFAHLGEPLDPDPLAFVDRHRDAFRALLSGARAVLFPSESAAKHVSRLLDLGATFGRVLPHAYDTPRARRRAAGAPASNGAPSEPLRVALVGQVAYAAKGADAYLETMERCAGANVEWHVFGQTDLFGFDEKLSALAPRVRVVRHGAYARDTIVNRLAEARVDVGLLLPAWPETYSYTLTEMLCAGVPVVARRIGALADRLEGKEHGRLVDDARAAAAELSRLSTDRSAARAMALAIPGQPGTADWARAHREVYVRCEDGFAAPARPASASEYRRLNEISSARRAVADDAVTVTRPSPAVTSAWWFQYAERMKPYVPESVRHAVRRRLSRDGSKAVLRFRLPGPRATLGHDLTVTQRYVGTTQLTSHGVDPFLVLGHDPIDPRSVRLVRFNLWCSTPTEVFAQLYWRHEGAADFDEEHSLTIPLNGRAGAWQEYVARLDGSRGARGWYEGGPVVALRFDPINVPGPIGLGELALCDAPKP